MAGLAQMLGIGGGMPSPEEMQKLAAADAGRTARRNAAAPPAAALPANDARPAAENFPGLPGLACRRLPGLGGFPGLGKKK